MNKMQEREGDRTKCNNNEQQRTKYENGSEQHEQNGENERGRAKCERMVRTREGEQNAKEW